MHKRNIDIGMNSDDAEYIPPGDNDLLTLLGEEEDDIRLRNPELLQGISSSIVSVNTGGVNASGEMNPSAAAAKKKANFNSSQQRKRKALLCNNCHRRFVHLELHKKHIHRSEEKKEQIKRHCVGCKTKFRNLKQHLKICLESSARNKKAKELLKLRSKEIDSKGETTATDAGVSEYNQNHAKSTNQGFQTEVEMPYSSSFRDQNGKRMKVCAVCNRTLTANNFRGHYRRAHEVVKMCSLCNQPASVDHFRTHCTLHGTLEIKVCSICNRLVTAKRIRRHYRKVHGIVEENKEDMCPVCNLIFANLALHTFHAHPELHGGSKLYAKCTHCLKIMKAKSLHKHMKLCPASPGKREALLEKRRNAYKLRRAKSNDQKQPSAIQEH